MRVLEKIDVLQKITLKKPKFQVIILDCKVNNNSFQGRILGRNLSEWVAFACGQTPFKIIDFDKKTNPLEFVRDKIDEDFDYTIILLSTTPLLENIDIAGITEYAYYKDIKLCKLPTGYVVNNKYLKQNSLQVDSVYSINIDNFYVVENKKQFTYALKVLQDRINNFHIGNGVEILKPDSVYIEPNVDIESGVIIYPNNSIKGETFIGCNVILKENNVIENSKILDNSCISGSVITTSTIEDNVYISPFCEIEKSKVGKDTIIEKGAVIKNKKIKCKSRISANSIL